MNDTIPHLVPYIASIPNPTRPLSRHLPTANRSEDASLPVSRQSPRTVSTRLLIIPAHFRHIPQSGQYRTEPYDSLQPPTYAVHALRFALRSFDRRALMSTCSRLT